MDRQQKSHSIFNPLHADNSPKATTLPVWGPTKPRPDACVTSQPTTPAGTTAPAVHPGRASPTSFPLSPPSTGVSDSYSRRDSLSYSPLLRETARSPQQLRDLEFTAASAVPNDDLVAILEGSPVGSISEGNLSPHPPPLPQLQSQPLPPQQRQSLRPPPPPQQQQLRQPLDARETRAATEPFKGFQVCDSRQSHPVVDPAGLYGVYDPSGVVEYLHSSPLVGEEQEEEEYYEEAEHLGVTTVTTAVTATFVVPETDVARVEALAQEALLSTALSSAAALTAGGESITDNVIATAAATLLSLHGLTALPPEELSAAAGTEALTDPPLSSQRTPTRFVHQPVTTAATAATPTASMVTEDYAAAASSGPSSTPSLS
ncbi:hypothetical protein Vafri_19253, partial [Volvox africanus]